tara:strand:- start:15 stop:254 length:240 start_codon:yes stop_codon:yes gene_type:complete
MKEYIITGKGNYKTMVNDPFIKGLEMCDIQSGYRHIKFKGTEKQLDAFVEKLIEDETNFKFIDWFEKDEYNNLERIPLL